MACLMGGAALCLASRVDLAAGDPSDRPSSGPSSSAAAPAEAAGPAEPARGWAEWKKFRDPKTGYEVWQITTDKAASVAPYFERQAFTRDDRYVLFTSNRTGEWRLYRADLADGRIVLVTSLAGRARSWTVLPDTDDAYVAQGTVLVRLNVPTLRAEPVLDLADRFEGRPRWSQSYSADGRFTVATSRDEDGTTFYHVDLKDRTVRKVFRWEGRLSHPLLCPTEPGLVSFVPYPDTQNDMTLPMEKRARTWLADCRTGRARPFLTCPYGFRATHETWSADGKRFYFFKKTQPGWVPVAICSIDRTGGDWREHYRSDLVLGHGISSADGRWFLSDGQKPGDNPLVLVDLASGAGETVCWPDASITGGHREHAHVHPSLSQTARFAVYTSDSTGTPQVYVVPLSQVKLFAARQGG